MPIHYLQGFEHVVATPATPGQVTATELRDLFNLDLPEHVADFFINASGGTDDSSGIMVVNDESYVSGQSLRIQRPDTATYNEDYNGSKVMDLTYSFIVSQTEVSIGFAIKFNKVPTNAVPLVRFMEGANEQASVWLNVEGGVFLSSTDVDTDITSTQTASVIADTATQYAGIFCTRWFYFEIYYKVDDDGGTVRIDVNGENLLNSTSSADFRKSSTVGIDTVSILNAPNLYFEDDDYTQWIDDIYVSGNNGLTTEYVSVLGPQHIVRLQPNGNYTSYGSINGPGSFTHQYELVQRLYEGTDNYVNQAQTGVSVFKMEDFNLNNNVTAVALQSIVEAEGSDHSVYLGLYYEDQEDEVSFDIEEIDGIQSLQYVHDHVPGTEDDEWNRKLLNVYRAGMGRA